MNLYGLKTEKLWQEFTYIFSVPPVASWCDIFQFYWSWYGPTDQLWSPESGALMHECTHEWGYFRQSFNSNQGSHFSSRKFRWALNEIFPLKLMTQTVYKFKSEISSRNFGKSKLIPTKIFIGERVSSKKLSKNFFVREIMIWDGPKVWIKIDGT